MIMTLNIRRARTSKIVAHPSHSACFHVVFVPDEAVHRLLLPGPLIIDLHPPPAPTKPLRGLPFATAMPSD